MEKNPMGLGQAIRKWIIDLISSFRILPKRPDVPTHPTHPSDASVT